MSPTEDLVIAVSHPVWTADMPQYREAYEDFKKKLTLAVPTVYAIMSNFEYPNFLDSISPDRRVIKVTARLHPMKDTVKIETYRSVSAGNPLTFQFTGPDLLSDAAAEQLSADLQLIEVVGVPILLVLLIIVFGGLMSAIAPLCLACWTVSAALAILRGMAQCLRVSIFVGNSTTIIGTVNFMHMKHFIVLLYNCFTGSGLAIDFSLFFHTRFKEEMVKSNNNVKASVVRMLETSGRSITFSAFTLCTCLSGLLQFSPFFITTMGAAIMIASSVAAVGAIFIIPCLV